MFPFDYDRRGEGRRGTRLPLFDRRRGAVVEQYIGEISRAGGGQPHENRPPHLVLTYCIALEGTFPTPSD